MKKLILVSLFLVNFSALADTGIVNVESMYQDISIPNSSVIYSGRGFVVEYPVQSSTTNNTVNLKVVLTAAHLVFGGISEDRLDNYKLFNTDTEEEISGLGMISDVIHDTAAIILCTEEAMSFFRSEFESKGINLSDLVNVDGHVFTEGGGCASKGQGIISKDVPAYARYVGSPILIDGINDTSFLLSDRTTGNVKIVVNQNIDVSYLSAGRMYAVPWMQSDESHKDEVTDGLSLGFNLNPMDQAAYLSLSEVPKEYSVPLSLDNGYSGSPIINYDANLNELLVTGIYKASTQASASDSYGDLGWVSPIEMSRGLINVFLNRYSQNLHRWNTVPQAYLSLDNNTLVRSMMYNHFLLYEGIEDIAAPTQPENENLSNWVRSDTGDTMWVRTDTGNVVSAYPQKSKQLNQLYSDGVNIYSRQVSGIAMINEINDVIVLPPVMTSVLHASKYNCESCVNSSTVADYQVVWITEEDEGNLGGTIWKSLNPDEQNSLSKNFVNANEKEKTKTLNINYYLTDENIKIELNWDQDSITFYILLNNNISYQKINGEWEETSFSSVLETKTKNGTPALLETSGVIYYNTELPNPKSFRLKLMNYETQLFEQRQGEL